MTPFVLAGGILSCRFIVSSDEVGFFIGPQLAARARCTEMRMSLCASAPAWSFVVSVLHGGCELLSLVILSGGVGWVVYGEGEVN